MALIHGSELTAAGRHEVVPLTKLYLAYALGLIWLVLLFRVVDLQIVATLLEGIRKEFAVSDTQLGLLTGFAFAIFYGSLGIPIARLADTGNRRNIIAVALALWSAMTTLCGCATGFWWLLAARMGVGVGEAGGSPPAYSLICDYFGPKRRATIFAVLNSAVPAGVFVGLLVGGYIVTSFGWRAAFFVVGAPGVLLAVLIALTLREPQRRMHQALDRRISSGVGGCLKFLVSMPSYRHLVLGSSLFTLGAMGSGIWIPSFFVRVHGMSMHDASTGLAIIYGAGGIVGVLVGGHLADTTARRTADPRWFAWVPAISTFAILPFAFLVYLWPSAKPAMMMQIGITVLMHMWMGPAYGTVQSLAGASRRAMAAALNMMVVNLIGYGFGPLLVGMASDWLRPTLGAQSLRYALLAVVVFAYGWAGIHFTLAAKSLRQDLAHGRAEASI
jgi:predicted MFS family arabinose efflux permease